MATLQQQTKTQQSQETSQKDKQLLEQYAWDAVNLLNTREVEQAFRYTSPDFIHDYTTPSGRIIELSASQTITQFQEKFAVEPSYQFSITSVDAQINEDITDKFGRKYATVWMSGLVRDGEEPGMRERVAIFSWRKERGGEWVWWRIACPSTANILPL